MDKGRGRKGTVLQAMESMCEGQEIRKDDKCKKLKEIQYDWDTECNKRVEVGRERKKLEMKAHKGFCMSGQEVRFILNTAERH